MLRRASIFILALTGISAARADDPSTTYMPPPSNDAATDAANFAAAQATGARTIVFQVAPDDKPYLMPPAGYAQLKSNQDIVGQGSGVTIIRITGQGTYTQGALYAIGQKNIKLSGFTLDYANKWAAPPVNGNNLGTLKIVNGTNINFLDVAIVDFPFFGLVIDGGNGINYRGGQIVRAKLENRFDSAGAAIPLGRQNQCVLVTSSSGSSTNFIFEDVTCLGSAFNTWGSDFTYLRTNVIGFDFGFAYVTEARPGNERHYFLNARASKGSTNPATGHDENDTVAGCFELWSLGSIVDGAVCDNVGGDGVSLGGKNSRVTNSKFTRLGMQVASAGIGARYLQNDYGIFSADGAYIAGNTVVNSNGSGDGSNLTLPYKEPDAIVDIKVTIGPNDFPATPMMSKGVSTVWFAPGMPVTAQDLNGYRHPAGTRQSPASSTIVGVRRGTDVVMGATFRAADGSTLPAGLRLSALIDADNSVRFYTEDISGGGTDIPVPAGTYFARVVTIN